MRKITPDFIVIFPNGSEPFMKGGYDARIAEVEALAQRLSSYPVLAALQTDVQNFATALHAARNTQQSKEDLLDKASDALEEQRIRVCNVLYGNLGRLMDKFSNAPDNAARFFDLVVLRESGNDEFPAGGDIDGNATVNIVQRQFEAGTQLLLGNKGTTPLMFCLAAHEGTACNAGVIVPPNGEDVRATSDLGDTANTFLNVTNLGSVQGSWEVEEV